jgi:hypothetical protein
LASTASSYQHSGLTSWLAGSSRFHRHSINREQIRYDYLASALTKEAVSLTLDVVEHPPEWLPYTALKNSLLDSHQLVDHQRITALHKMAALGVAGNLWSCWPVC